MASALELLLLTQTAALQQGPWTAYSPTWTAAGGGAAIGNGSIVGYYAKFGYMVTAKIAVYSGSTTAFGSNYYSLGLPFTAAANSIPSGGFAHVGVTTVTEAATWYSVNAMILQSTPTVVNGTVNGSGSFFGATNPVSLTTGASWVTTITYESTS